MILKHSMNEEREQYFFDNVKIKEEDIPRAKQAIYSKGIEKHIIILEMLKPWVEEEKVPYEYIASFYRYDKRLRKVLFVFISYLEEYYRSIILDKYRFDWSGLYRNRYLASLLHKYKDMDKALEKLDFSHLINQIYKTRDAFDNIFVFPDNAHLKKNKDALIELRNCVMHNRFLLLYRGYKECYVDGTGLKSATLKDNIKNLINFLPENVREKCKSDINDCAKEKNNICRTGWIIPQVALIEL